MDILVDDISPFGRYRLGPVRGQEHFLVEAKGAG